MRRLYKACAVMGGLSLGLGAEGAWARFLEHDRLRVDQEERYGRETYNDKLSYRYPQSWRRAWQDHASGVRLSAGSLNATRFDYSDEIKFTTDVMAPYAFSFHHMRQEDSLEQRSEDDVRIAWRFAGPLRLSLMADGGAIKELGDVGAALAIYPDADRKLEVFYWSVDHFYDTKKPFAADRRSRPAASYGLNADWRFSPQVRVWGFAEDDAAFVWHLASEGFDYAYARTVAEVGLQVGQAERFVYGQAFLERKREKKSWFETDSPDLKTQSKSMKRRASIYEVGVVDAVSEDENSAALQYVMRDAGAQSTPDLPEASYKEPLSLSHIRRRELGLTLQRHVPWKEGKHYLLWGMQASDVRIHKEACDCVGEVKLQTAWDYRFDQKSRLMLNFTWDIDQLYEDFPYQKEAFRPWGGGHIQLQIVL